MSIRVAEIDLGQGGVPKETCVTLAQTQVPDPSLTRPDEYLDSVKQVEKAKLITEQEGRIRKQLERALFDEPNFILFPELSIPWEMQDELRQFAIGRGVYIIGGLCYGPDYENACAVFPPFESENIPLQYKLNRAPGEDQNVRTGDRILIYRNSGFGHFTSIICYDFTSLRIAREIRDRDVSILFLPTRNHAVDMFEEMATSQCYTIYTYICLCNAAGSGFGNSASYGPVRKTTEGHLQQKRVIGKLAGSQQTTLTTKLDIPELLESIKRFKDNRSVLGGFITPPADLRKPGAVVSPYTPLGPAKENFVGRDKQIRQFWAYIESNNHVLLLGPSGTGKTSLIHRLRAETPLDCQVGFIEVYDTDGTFEFLRRLSIEISSKAETEKPSVKFRDTLQTALDDIQKTRDAVEQYGFQESSKAFIEAFHNLAQAIDAQKIGRIVVFIDQAERLAWLEEDPKRQPYAIRILIRVMRELQSIGAPVLFAPAIRQHDYDPLIALASNHIPARIVPLQKFSKTDAILAIERPLPPEITIDREVSSQIADLSGGVAFFVQLLADAAFKKLGEREHINGEVFDELQIQHQTDIFPLLMRALTPNEQRFVEAMGMCREYTVQTQDILTQLNVEPEEFRHVADQLLGKNIIEALENDRFRFVHDQMKGFIQREWLAAKISRRERLRAETETALQMLFISPEDEITVRFNVPAVAMCCFKSLLLDDIDNLSRLLEQVPLLKHRVAADLCASVSIAAFSCTSRNVFASLRSKVIQLLEGNAFYSQVSIILAIEISHGEAPDIESAERAIDLAEKLASESEEASDAMAYCIQGANWAKAIGDSSRKDELFYRFSGLLTQTLEKDETRELLWPVLDGGFSGGFWGGASAKFMDKAASWARELGYAEQGDEFLKIAFKLASEEVGQAATKGLTSASMRDYEHAADLAQKIGDQKRATEFYLEAIELARIEAKQEEEDEKYRDAYRSYATAVDFALRIGEGKIAEDMYEQAILLAHRAAAKAQAQEEHSSASNDCAAAADLAVSIGKTNVATELYRQGIALARTAGEKAEAEENYSSAGKHHATAADLAHKIGDNKLADQLYRKAIALLRARAARHVKKGHLSSVAADYIRAAKWADAIGDEPYLDSLYREAATTLHKATETYAMLTPFLLDHDTLGTATALHEYYSNDEEKSAYFSRVLSVVQNCRQFFSDRFGPFFLP